jgi:predicted MFS family arabinose efflux permease
MNGSELFHIRRSKGLYPGEWNRWIETWLPQHRAPCAPGSWWRRYFSQALSSSASSIALAFSLLFIPFVFLPAFARDHGVSEVAAAGLVSVIGGASVIGRVALGPIGDRLAVLPLFKLTVFLMGISYAIWLLSSSYESLLFLRWCLASAMEAVSRSCLAC